MSRYIDADALKERLIQNITFTNAIDRSFSEAPSIDIVRCKECRYKDMDICPMYRLVVAGVRKADDFCSYGEREGE